MSGGDNSSQRKRPEGLNDVNDPNKYRGKFEREDELLDNLDHTTDAKKLRSWAATLPSKYEYSTARDHIQRLRVLSRRSDIPLVEMSKDEFYALHSRLRRGDHPDSDVPDDGLADGTLRNLRQSVRLFFREELERDWANDIHLGNADTNRVSPEDLLTSEEISALFNAAMQPRDEALLGILLTTGQRITAVLSLRVGDVELGDHRSKTARIHLNDEALGLKNASGPRPLIWASGYVSKWLEAHPRPEADAPLICTLKSGQYHERGDPLSRTQAHARLKRIAERADVDADKVNPHNFRHTAITRMNRDGLTEQRIKWMVGWDKDSTQFERYSHLTNEQMMHGILESYDLAPDDPEDGHPEIDNCLSCKEPLRPGASFCPSCGWAQNHGVVETTHDRLHDTVLDGLTDEEIPAEFDTAQQVLAKASQDPKFVEYFLKQLNISAADEDT